MRELKSLGRLVAITGALMIAAVAAMAHSTDVVKPSDFVARWEFEGNLADIFGQRPFWVDYEKRMNSGMATLGHPQASWDSAPRFSVILTSVTVAQILDVVTAADGRYYWTYSNGTFDFLPRPSQDEWTAVFAPLERRIPRFEAKARDIHDLASALGETAEAYGVSGLSFPPAYKNPCRLAYAPDGYSITAEGKTVRELLDFIVALDPPSRWLAYPWNGKVIVSALQAHSMECLKPGEHE